MILDELVLHDFGLYGGRQSLILTPAAPDRPIVLIGGLNGGGKTTLLEAIQLCLFGSAAPAVARSQGGYLEHLRRRIHRQSDVQEAGVELSFRHTSNGTEHSYRLIRSWSVASGGACREAFEVLRDGTLDRVATENWAERVEEFMPARIASLFLFDGEKIESYADPEEAPALIATAVHNLLGLDIVEMLAADLSTLERRKRADRPVIEGGTAADQARALLAERRERRVELHRIVAAGNDALDRASREMKAVDERFRREGGDLYERRAAIEAETAQARRDATESERMVRELSGGAAPLLLVSELLLAVRDRDREEQETRKAAEMSNALLDEHAALMDIPQIAALPSRDRWSIEATLAERREALAELGDRKTHLDLPPEAQAHLASFVGAGLDELRTQVMGAVGRANDTRLAADGAEAALEAIPSTEALERLQSDRSKLRADVARLEAETRASGEALAAADREIEQLREREARLAEQEAVERFHCEDVDRTLAHSARVRSTLLRFREAVVERHVERIQRLVLESFQGLVRKPDLVTGLRIDPRGFAIELTGSDGRPLAASQLSAGERQLLAVAMLWGLARASGRPLPTVIDTPLGRLDSEHRSRLVDRYFPHASHQVILLSTDEEIAGGYHEALLGSIGRSYRLGFDADRARTVVEEGYLETGEMRRVA